MSASNGPITPADLEAKLRSIIGGADEAAEAISSRLIAAAGAVLAVAVLSAFLFGRRRGRRRSTTVEIIRA